MEKTTGIFVHDGTAEADLVTEVLDGGNLSLRPTKLPITEVVSVTDREYGEVITDFTYTKMRVLRTNNATIWNSGINRWQVVYHAGYGPDDYPAGLKLAVLDLVTRAYWNRGGRSSEGGSVTVSWEKLAKDSDLLRKLKPFSMKLSVG